MSLKRFILPVLAGAQLASAAACSAKTTTITNAIQASSIAAACQTFTGNIAIATDATDPIDLTGIKAFKSGGIRAVNNGGLPSLTSNTLETIDGSFYLDNVTALNGLTFPLLTEVDELHWVSLASLYSWTLTSGLTSAQTVVISDTQVSLFGGLNLKTVGALQITNNVQLSNITMQLQNVTESIIISQNGQMPTVSFPLLETANNISYTGVSLIDLSSLKTVTQTIGIYESNVQNLTLPKLTSVGGLALVNSPGVEDLSVPKLQTIGGALTVTNNTGLTGALSFPQVSQVHGAVKIVGGFSGVSMPDLTYVRGAFTIKSTKDIKNTCSHFDGLGSGTLQGKESCTYSTPSPSSSASPTSGSGGSPTGGSASTTSTTGAAALTYGSTPMVGGVIGLCLAILGML